jgi:chaperonin GroES
MSRPRWARPWIPTYEETQRIRTITRSKEQHMAKKKTAKKPKSKPKIHPLGAKVLVKRLEAEEMTTGGIVLPDTAKEKPQKGTVIEVGEGKLLDDGTRAKFQVAKGDKVIFTSYAGTDIKIGGEEHLLMDESDILAILS